MTLRQWQPAFTSQWHIHLAIALATINERYPPTSELELSKENLRASDILHIEYCSTFLSPFDAMALAPWLMPIQCYSYMGTLANLSISSHP